MCVSRCPVVRRRHSGLWGQIADASNPTAYVVCGLDGSKVTVQKTGGGDMSEVMEALQADQIQFVGLRVTAVDVKGARKSVRSKLVYISWTGPSVKVMAKAKATPLKASVQAHFQGAHVDFAVFDYDEISEDIIRAKLLASGGAHKPQFYHFGFYADGGPASPAAGGGAAGAGAGAGAGEAAAEPAAEAAAEPAAEAAAEPAADADAEPAAEAAVEPAAEAAAEPAADAAAEPAADAAAEPAADAAAEPAADAAAEPAADADAEPAADADAEPAADAAAEPAADADAEPAAEAAAEPAADADAADAEPITE